MMNIQQLMSITLSDIIKAYHLSGFQPDSPGFKVCFPCGTSQLKPDYRMFGFGSND